MRTTARVLAEGVAARRHRQLLPWSKALTQWRDRVMFLRRAEGDEWPDLSDAALAANVDCRLIPAFAAARPRSSQYVSPDDLQRCADRAVALAVAPPPRGRSAPTHFEAPTGRWRTPRSTMRPKPGRPFRSACRSCSASSYHPSDRGRAHCASHRRCCRPGTNPCRSRATCPASGVAPMRGGALRKCAGAIPATPGRSNPPRRAADTARAKPRGTCSASLSSVAGLDPAIQLRIDSCCDGCAGQARAMTRKCRKPNSPASIGAPHPAART